MSENKLVKSLTDAAVVVGIASGIGYVGKKMLKESFISDPSTSIANYGKWVLVLAESLYAKQYLEDQKILIMASIALMIGRAILNVMAFTGSMYLAKYFEGKHTDEERIRHDKALEKYEKKWVNGVKDGRNMKTG